MEFISTSTDGFDTLVTQQGTSLSGGQKQRLSIARAIAKHPDIYIFDDSFSALDYKTDATLRAKLKEKTSESTVMIVAQRISTILHADQIIVLDDGQIVGKGTHKELLKNCEAYYQIASSQLSEKELEEFNAVAVLVLEQLNYNRTENKRLSALRDALLPKLMSGELDVSDIEI